ncbi:MAG: GNAT family N-acetyltransferase [Phyllobacteriaceae bacterium]|nr:GNAT family N-acetyltransferase [Phyllobacteriaceae bacterium]
MTETPFAARRHPLGTVELVPIATAAIPEIATRMAAIDPWARLRRPAAAMAERIAVPDPGAHRFSIESDGAILGYVSIRHPFLRGPYLEQIAIFPEAQRRGLARRVLDWMAGEVEGLESNLWLCVTEWNEGARATYRALGFDEVAPLPDLVAPGQSEIFMRRRLDAAPAA